MIYVWEGVQLSQRVQEEGQALILMNGIMVSVLAKAKRFALRVRQLIQSQLRMETPVRQLLMSLLPLILTLRSVFLKQTLIVINRMEVRQPRQVVVWLLIPIRGVLQ